MPVGKDRVLVPGDAQVFNAPGHSQDECQVVGVPERLDLGDLPEARIADLAKGVDRDGRVVGQIALEVRMPPFQYVQALARLVLEEVLLERKGEHVRVPVDGYVLYGAL